LTDRRELLRLLALIPAASLIAPAAADAFSPQKKPHGAAIPNMVGSEQIAMLLYPGFTALDFVGPHFFFSGLMVARVHIVTNQATLAPVTSDAGIAITPTARFSDLPATLDVIFAPGGFAGTLAAMAHAPTLDFLRTWAPTTRFKTSVCTGSFLLAAAGLLKGRKATSHWVARETLSKYGATPTDQRIVRDGDIITGAGVSAGLDMAIAVVDALRGPAYAKAQMLQAEYAPAPPFAGGRPDNTDPAITQAIRSMLAGFNAGAERLALHA
jgi:putative intracellular protease/amidase